MVAPAIQSREEWLAQRRHYLGGTDVAAIVGKHKYKTALGVYAEKALGVYSDNTEEKVVAMMGLALEPVVRFVVQRDMKQEVRPSCFVVDSEHPFLAVNPDGEFDELNGCELKTHGFATRDEWGEEMTDEVPDAYHVQATWQCGLKGWDRCYIVAFDRDKGTARYYVVDANPEYFESLRKIAVGFWFGAIVARKEPVATEPGDLAVVRAMYRRPELQLIVATGEIDDIAAQHKELAILTRKAKTETDALKARIIQTIGIAEGITTAEGTYTYRADKNGTRKLLSPRGWE